MHIFFGSQSDLNWCTFIVKTPTIVLKSLKKLEEHAKSAMVSQKIIFLNCIFLVKSSLPDITNILVKILFWYLKQIPSYKGLYVAIVKVCQSESFQNFGKIWKFIEEYAHGRKLSDSF